MPTQFDHLVAEQIRARLASTDDAQFSGAVRELVTAHNRGRKKGRLPTPGDPANLATHADRLLGLLWGLSRNVRALHELLQRHGFTPPPVPASDQGDPATAAYGALAKEPLQCLWDSSRDSSALEALWLLDRTLGRHPAPDSVLAFRWWHFGDETAIEHLLRRLGLYVFVTPDLVERCVTPDNQARLLDRYGQVVLPPGSGTIDEFAGSVVAVLLDRIRTYWNLRAYWSVRSALPKWVRSRIADRANRDKLERDILHRLADPGRRRNRLPITVSISLDEPTPPGQHEVGRTVRDVIRLATLIRNRARLGAPAWSDEELLELSHINLRWLGEPPSPGKVREAREVIAEDTAAWGPGSEPTEEEIRSVFGWFPESGPRVAEQVVLRGELDSALEAALTGLRLSAELSALRDDVLGRMREAIDWVRDQRRHLRRPVPKFACLLVSAQELWWAIGRADMDRARHAELQACHGLFQLFCRCYRAARLLAPCYLIAGHLESAVAHDLSPVRSAVPGHPPVVRWLEEGHWRDNFALRPSRATPYGAEEVRRGVVEWLGRYARVGPTPVRVARQILRLWLNAVPPDAGFLDEVAALDIVYWSQTDPSNQTRWGVLRADRPALGQPDWPRLDLDSIAGMIEAAGEGAWLRVADLAAGVLPAARVTGDRRWSPALEIEFSLRALGSLGAQRRRALGRCRELFAELTKDIQCSLTELGTCLANDPWWAAPDLAAGQGWWASLDRVAGNAAADSQARLNLLQLWLSVCLRPEGVAVSRLEDLDTAWIETDSAQGEPGGAWKTLAGRLPSMISNAARGNWRATARLAGNALADVPDGPGSSAAVFSALRRMADGGRTTPVLAARGHYE